MTSHQNQVLKVIKEQNLTERRIKQSSRSKNRTKNIKSKQSERKTNTEEAEHKQRNRTKRWRWGWKRRSRTHTKKQYSTRRRKQRQDERKCGNWNSKLLGHLKGSKGHYNLKKRQCFKSKAFWKIELKTAATIPPPTAATKTATVEGGLHSQGVAVTTGTATHFHYLLNLAEDSLFACTFYV